MARRYRKQRQLPESECHLGTGAQDLRNAEQSQQSVGSRLLKYLRGNGFGLVLSGIAFFFTPYFQLGVGFFLIGSALLAVDVWNEVAAATQKRFHRVAFLIACALYIAGFAVWLLWPCSLEVSANSSVPKYGPGSNLYGILWSDAYARLASK